jgi:hypothetical protein
VTLTEEEARAFPCPIARIKGQEPIPARCEASACILWRWQPLDAALLIPHVKARRKEIGPYVEHKEAVAWVMENREKLGIPTKPTHGFCGLGGQVLA